MRALGAHYACALIVQDGKILLGKRAPFRKAYPDHWDVIGGKIEEGESREEALMRELGEEIGILPLDARYLSSLEDWRAEAERPPVYHFFKVTQWSGGAPYLRNHEHTALAWLSLDAIAELPNLASEDYTALFEQAMLV